MSPPATPGLLHWLIPPPPSPNTGTPAGIPRLPSLPLRVNGDPSPGFTECHAVASTAQRSVGSVNKIMLSSFQCLLCSCLLWSLCLVCTSTAGLFSGIVCTTWRNFLVTMVVIVSRHDLVLSLSLGMSNGAPNPVSPGREVYLLMNGIKPPSPEWIGLRATVIYPGTVPLMAQSTDRSLDSLSSS